jgi:hypothetical protein
MADRAGERVPSQCDQIALGNARRLFHEAKAGTKPPGAKKSRNPGDPYGRGWPGLRTVGSCRSLSHPWETGVSQTTVSIH